MAAQDRNRPKTFDEAIEKLEAAIANPLKPDVTAKVSEGISDIQNIFKSGAQESAQAFAGAGRVVFEQLGQYANVGTEQAKIVAATMDRKVRENPWPYIAGAGVALFAFGLFLGRGSQQPRESETTHTWIGGES